MFHKLDFFLLYIGHLTIYNLMGNTIILIYISTNENQNIFKEIHISCNNPI